MAGTFETFIEKERERLNRAREDALTRQREIAGQIENIDRELYAIRQYEAAKKGKPIQETRSRRGSGKRGQFGARENVLAEVKKHPDGVSSSDVFQALNLPDTKQARQFVSNALSHFKRQGQLKLENGLYSTQ